MANSGNNIIIFCYTVTKISMLHAIKALGHTPSNVLHYIFKSKTTLQSCRWNNLQAMMNKVIFERF
jgi:hypothetical protein